MFATVLLSEGDDITAAQIQAVINYEIEKAVFIGLLPGGQQEITIEFRLATSTEES